MENLTYTVNKRSITQIHVIQSKYLLPVKAIVIDSSWSLFLAQLYGLLFTFSSSMYLKLSYVLISLFCNDYLATPVSLGQAVL